MPIFRIHHLTKYEYDRQVKESMNEIRIFPYTCREQEILQHELLITGNPGVYTYSDYWDNKTGIFSILDSHKELLIESRLVIRTTAGSQLAIDFHSTFEDLYRETKSQLRLLELAFPDTINKKAEIEQIIRSISEPNSSVATTVERCCEFIYKNFRYRKGITSIETTVDEILEHRSGVCQDFAHVMLQILRTLNIPSRYVSGYICPHKNGMRGEGATHAWVEAWIPGYGWAGIDPTNNIWVTNNHVKLAVGRNFSDCSPLKGSFKGPAQQKLSIFVSVGYEDGQMFEDVNKVQLSGYTGEVPPLLDVMSNQQQQQQQQ